MQQLYGKEYFEPESQVYSYGKQIAETATCFFEAAATFRARLSCDGPVLDIGCATGEFLLALRNVGIRGVGLELSLYALGVAQSRGLEVIAGDMFASELNDRTFAGIYMSHVLEHLPDAQAAMRRIRSFLRKESLIYIEVPYQFDSLLSRLNRYLGRNAISFEAFSIHHCTFFTPTSMQTLLEQHGLEIILLTTYRSCRRAGRTPSLRHRFLSAFLWLSDRLFKRGDVIAVWARPHHG